MTAVPCTCGWSNPYNTHAPACAVTERAVMLMAERDRIEDDITHGRIGLEGYRLRFDQLERDLNVAGAFVISEFGTMLLARRREARELNGHLTVGEAMAEADRAEGEREDLWDEARKNGVH